MQRTDPDLVADELTQLTQFLDYHRATLAQKAGGLTREQLGTRVGASTLTLAGLVNHAALNEDHWFGVVLLGHPSAEPWASAPWDDDPDWEFRTALDLDPPALLDRYARDVCAQPRQRRRGRRRRRARLPLGSPPATARARRFNLRWILLHMLEETARHNGHADLLREAADGETGE